MFSVGPVTLSVRFGVGLCACVMLVFVLQSVSLLNATISVAAVQAQLAPAGLLITNLTVRAIASLIPLSRLFPSD